MSGTIGREDKSVRVRDLLDSKELAFGSRKIVFAHESASGGEVVLDMNALVTPTLYSANGFVNAPPTEIAGAKIYTFKKNLTLKSSARGDLHQWDSFVIESNMRIRFTGGMAAGLLAGEIIVGFVDQVPISPIIVADGRVTGETYSLGIGVTTLNLGREYVLNAFPSIRQVGNIRVRRNGVSQLQNVGNAAAAPLADGNFHEDDSGNGTGTTIEFNVAPVGQPDVIEVEFGLITSNGDLNILGSLDRMSAALAVLAQDAADGFGFDITRYLTLNPSEIERRAFGDLVGVLDRLVNDKQLDSGVYTPVLTNGSNATSISVQPNWTWVRVGNIVNVTGYLVANASVANTDTWILAALPVIGSGVFSVHGVVSMQNTGTERNSGVVDRVGNEAQIYYNPATVNARAWKCSFQYAFN